jgi:hypothetical protein
VFHSTGVRIRRLPIRLADLPSLVSWGEVAAGKPVISSNPNDLTGSWVAGERIVIEGPQDVASSAADRLDPSHGAPVGRVRHALNGFPDRPKCS